MLTGRPMKLRDDSWGAWVNGRAVIGEEVRLTTAAGKSFPKRISAVIRQKSDGAVCRVVRIDQVLDDHEPEPAENGHAGTEAAPSFMAEAIHQLMAHVNRLEARVADLERLLGTEPAADDVEPAEAEIIPEETGTDPLSF